MSALPNWAKKPVHKKEVIPTNRGWVVKETGEILSSYKGLLDKLEALNVEISDFQTDVVVPEKEDDDVTDELPELTTTESASGDQQDGKPEAELEQGKEEKSEDEKTEVKKEEQPKKRRGRPPANKKNA